MFISPNFSQSTANPAQRFNETSRFAKWNRRLATTSAFNQPRLWGVGISPVLVGLLSACGGEKTYRVQDTTTPLSTDVDLYVNGGGVTQAAVYQDVNGNNQIDPEDTLLGVTDASGHLTVSRSVVEQGLLVDLNGAIDLYAGEKLSGVATVPLSSPDAVQTVSAITQLLHAVITDEQTTPAPRSEAVIAPDFLQKLFGTGTSIRTNDITNPKNYLPNDDGENVKADLITQINARVQNYIDQYGSAQAAAAHIRANGFSVTDLPAADHELANLNDRVSGVPLALPVEGLTAHEHVVTLIKPDSWGFFDLFSSDGGPATGFAKLRILGAADSDGNPVTLFDVNGRPIAVGAELEGNDIQSLRLLSNSEVASKAIIQYQVYDGEAWSQQADLVVSLTHIDDAPKFFSPAKFSNYHGQLSTFTVFANDPEGTDVSYVLDGPDAALFELNSVSGQLRFKAAPNLDDPKDANGDNVYEISIRASDTTGQVTTQNVQVSVLVNPNAEPKFSDDLYNLSLPEGETDVAAILVSASTNRPGITYSITGGDDAALLDINAITGVLSFKSAVDFENPTDHDTDGVYQVLVTASAGDKSDTQILLV